MIPLLAMVGRPLSSWSGPPGKNEFPFLGSWLTDLTQVWIHTGPGVSELIFIDHSVVALCLHPTLYILAGLDRRTLRRIPYLSVVGRNRLLPSYVPLTGRTLRDSCLSISFDTDVISKDLGRSPSLRRQDLHPLC